MQVIDDTGPPQVEEVLAQAAIARPVALPGADVRQVVFHLHALPQRRRQRPLSLPVSGERKIPSDAGTMLRTPMSENSVSLKTASRSFPTQEQCAAAVQAARATHGVPR